MRRGGGLTMLTGLGMLAALIAMVVFAVRVGDGEADTTGALPTLPAGALTVGLQDDRLTAVPPAELAPRLDRLKASGIAITRVDVGWAQIAPTKPAAPADPNDPAYTWTQLDAILDGLRDREVDAMVAFSQAPTWANGGKGPEWIPPVADYGAFVRAFATRYNGTSHAAVRIYEPWTEPNSPATLMPQWEGTGPTAKAVSPARYAELLGRARAEIRAVAPDARVAGLGLADIDQSAPGVGGVGVSDFVNALVPLRPAMDATSQHIVGGGQPAAQSARIPSIGGIDRLLAEFDKVAPGKELLVTAVGYSTSPGGLSEADQARYLSQTMTTLARSPRVRLAIWYSLQDSLQRPAGLVREDGSEKPAWKAFVDGAKSIPSKTP